jgi:hypothetical protein
MRVVNAEGAAAVRSISTMRDVQCGLESRQELLIDVVEYAAHGRRDSFARRLEFPESCHSAYGMQCIRIRCGLRHVQQRRPSALALISNA